MIKFSITIKDEFSDVSVEGDSKKEILENLKTLLKLKQDSDKQLGFDIKIPNIVKNEINTLTNIERIMVLLFFGDFAMTRTELHERSKNILIKESWWNGRNFSRDIRKKISEKLIIKEDEPPKYKLSTLGRNFIQNNILKKQGD